MTFIYTEKTMDKIRSIEKVINGILDIREASQLLKCSERTIYRMKKQFINLGPPGLIHGLKGKPSNHQGENTKYADIRNILVKNTKYHDFGPTLFSQWLEKNTGLLLTKKPGDRLGLKQVFEFQIPKRKKSSANKEK